MPEYLLDTTAIIEYLRDKSGMPELLTELCNRGGLLSCCPLNIAEVYQGMKDNEKAATDEFLNTLKCYEITADIGYLAGEIKRNYLKKGITFSIADVLIAATAIKNHLILLTNNMKHFPSKETNIYAYER